MADVEGAWECLTETPMGPQASTLTVQRDGDRWTGTNAGDLGTLDIIDGRIEGDTLIWKMEIKTPFPMILDCTATVTGNSIEGGVTAGAFGTFPMTGERR